MGELSQVAAIPVRRGVDGTWEVLLVTTRETRRWVVPKGWPWAERPDHEAAAREAWEEAGIKGHIRDEPLGTFRYDKRRSQGEIVPVRVVAYLMEVIEELEDWPERAQRQRAWFSLDAAVETVFEGDLKLLLRAISGT
jgi:8-oxo-dGTP pyrophosphatase MutT (NUDIX family)